MRRHRAALESQKRFHDTRIARRARKRRAISAYQAHRETAAKTRLQRSGERSLAEQQQALARHDSETRSQRTGDALRNTAAARIDPAISYRSPSLPARIRPMKLQQLRYVIQVAESGSLTAAAEKLFVAQPSLSKAVSELEREMDITIFTRSRTGVVPTEEGMRFLSRARQVIEQADLLEGEYKGADRIRHVFGISTQHYAFVVNAFVSLVREYDRNRYEFSLRETSTAGIIDDVRVQRSELGVLYRCDFNESVISNVVKSADLYFVPLFRAKPHVFVSRDSPLAHLERVTLADLAPYPRLSYDQGIRNSLYYAEELHIAEAVDKSIVVTDRATLFNLIIGLDGYTISSGILSEDLNGSQIVSIPLESPEHMELGYVKRADRPLSSVAERYLQLLQEYVNEYQREAGE